MRRDDVVLLSTADWDNPFWTNKQHVAVQLALRGHRVLYIDSLGVRRPSASKQDVTRIFKRLRRGLRPPRQVRDNLWVWSPLVLPFQQVGLVRRFNKIWLSLWLAVQLLYLGMKRDILWTYNPLTVDLLGINGFGQLVYHCVDNIKAQPGMPSSAIKDAEQRLIKRADIVFATSPSLAESCRVDNSNTHYFPNVADYDHFSKAMSPETAIPEDLQRIPAPRIGFIGAISGYKVDFDLLNYLAANRRDWSIVLIGQIGEGDPWTDASALQGVPNLHVLGARDYSTLPNYLKGIDVALLPNRLNEYTDGMFPMKFFEYLAAGRPVVSVRLSSLAGFEDLVYLAESPEDFMHKVQDALDENPDSCAHRRSIAKGQTYASRMDKMMTLLEAGAGAPGKI